ncbi:heterogeneous nuclear ribonucleoprotein A1, A2/B1 homolog [Drosophila eugracilis]|uniref:heterogeneous nuclear ribonucleoprotein A1, A2/B1 homolog n=1 Tax=Drosophila eugracilis TaxID=29029 RepID=UPI0007E68467|nr:heterogeneous nuclear ribonucleoprotein A1, A2/B1 homolog [Drosophila eugracilis]
MRLTLLALIGVLCLAYSYALDDATNNDQVIGLLDVADQGANHANDGAREARQWGGGWGGRRGGWGGGGWGGGRHGGWGGGGWGGGRGGWGGGGWGGGHRGWGGGGWGR